MSGEINIRNMNLTEYENLISKSLSAGTKGKVGGAAKAQQVVDNLSHNVKVFLKQVHTYFKEGKWRTSNPKILEGKLLTIEKNIDRPTTDRHEKIIILHNAIGDTKRLIESFKEAGASKKEIKNLQEHLTVLDKKLNEVNLDIGGKPDFKIPLKEKPKAEERHVEARKPVKSGEELVVKELVQHKEQAAKKAPGERLKDRVVREEKNLQARNEPKAEVPVHERKEEKLQVIPFAGIKVVDHNPKRRSDNLERRGIEKEINVHEKPETAKTKAPDESLKKAAAAPLPELSAKEEKELRLSPKEQLSDALTNLIEIALKDEKFVAGYRHMMDSKELQTLNDFKGFNKTQTNRDVKDLAATLIKLVQIHVKGNPELKSNKNFSEAFNEAKSKLADYSKIPERKETHVEGPKFNPAEWKVDKEFFAEGEIKGAVGDFELGRTPKEERVRKGASTTDDTAGVKVSKVLKKEAKEAAEMMIKSKLDKALHGLIGDVLEDKELAKFYVLRDFEVRNLLTLQQFRSLANENNMQRVRGKVNQMLEIIIDIYSNNQIAADAKILEQIHTIQTMSAKLGISDQEKGKRAVDLTDELEVGEEFFAEREIKGAFTTDDTAGVKVSKDLKKEAKEAAETKKKGVRAAERVSTHNKEMMIKSNLDKALHGLIGNVLKDEAFVKELQVPGDFEMEDTRELIALQNFTTLADVKNMQRVRDEVDNILEIITNNYNTKKIALDEKILEQIRTIQTMSAKIGISDQEKGKRAVALTDKVYDAIIGVNTYLEKEGKAPDARLTKIQDRIFHMKKELETTHKGRFLERSIDAIYTDISKALDVITKEYPEFSKEYPEFSIDYNAIFKQYYALLESVRPSE